MSLNGSGELIINLNFLLELINASKIRAKVAKKYESKRVKASADYRNFPRDGKEKLFLLAHSFKLSTLIKHRLLKSSDPAENIAVDFVLARIIC